jgi:hypothetical protein
MAVPAGECSLVAPTSTEIPKALTTDAVVTIVFHSAVRAMSQARKIQKPIPKG